MRIKNVWTDHVFKRAGYKDIDWPWLLKQNDLVLVGYRGMDGSVTLNCPDFQRALKSENNPLSSQSLEKFGKALHHDFQRLKRDGVDIDGYNLVEVVDDSQYQFEPVNFTPSLPCILLLLTMKK